MARKFAETCLDPQDIRKERPASNWHQSSISFRATIMAVHSRLVIIQFLLLAVFSAFFTNATDTAEDGQRILVNEISRASNQSLLWGPYRPNLYFGIKPRIPNSLITGLMWSRVEDFRSVQNSLFPFISLRGGGI